MEIRTTNVMCNWIKKALKENPKFKNYVVSLQKYEYGNYCWHVGEPSELDYDSRSGKYNAIKISYPDSYYANDRHLNSETLISIFRRSNKTPEGFRDRILEEIEI